MPEILFKFLGVGGSPWCIGVPARDLTQADLDEFKLTRKRILAIVKPDGTPLYEAVKVKKVKKVGKVDAKPQPDLHPAG